MPQEIAPSIYKLKYDFKYLTEFGAEVRRYFEQACTYLNIEKPKLLLLHGVDRYGEQVGSYDEDDNIIKVVLVPENERIIVEEWLKRYVTLTNNREAIIFTLFHELGHCWHITKHKNHWHKFKPYYKYHDECSLEEYQKQQFELIADKIGSILFKQLYLGQNQCKI